MPESQVVTKHDEEHAPRTCFVSLFVDMGIFHTNSSACMGLVVLSHTSHMFSGDWKTWGVSLPDNITHSKINHSDSASGFIEK